MMNHAIVISHLSKSFISSGTGHRRVVALNDVSLAIPSGETVGILGPNGAGKTTLLNVLSTLLLPDSGTIHMLGKPYTPKNFQFIRSQINMSSGYPNFPWSLTVKENLRFYGRLYGLSGIPLQKKIEHVVEMFELNDYFDRRFDELSSGTKQRLSLAKALLNDPKIVFLDEPTIGLDPDVAIRTREVIAKVFKEMKVTVLLMTHYMKEAEQMCHRIAFIKNGEVITYAPIAQLKAMQAKTDLEDIFIKLAKSKHHDKHINANEQLISVSEEKFSTVSFVNRLKGWGNRCLAFSYRNFLFAWRNVFAFVELLFWPIVTVLSMGLLGNYLQLGDKALSFILTGAIAGGLLQVTQLDVAYSLLYEVWSKSMKNTFLSPVGDSEHLFGSWLIGMGRGLLIFVFLGVLAHLMFHFQFPSFFVTLLFLIGMFCCAILLGLLVSVLILIFGQKADITAWMFAYLFMLLCGIYYPVSTLPVGFYQLAQFIPITYFLEYFREALGFQPEFSHVIVKGFSLVGAYLVLGIWAMRQAFTIARRQGTIVRLSE